jgi:uncharacterized protein YjbI with pentapeptide repeats
METRWNDITSIWKQWRWSYELGGGMLLVLIGVWIGSLLFATDAGYGTNLYTEALGVLVTIAVLDRFARQREIDQLKQRLVREVGSRDNSTAVSAIDWMRHEGWLEGENGLLKGADLSRANLENADFGNKANLEGANLQETNLSGVKLPEANLTNANLQQANLTSSELQKINLTNGKLLKANLTEANLTIANLRQANLCKANLTGAELVGANLANVNLSLAELESSELFKANLENASLFEANLIGVDLRAVNLSNTNLLKANLVWANSSYATYTDLTILPDSEFKGRNRNGKVIYDKYWTPDTDMTRYTDPNHPDFWQPEWAKDSDDT